MKTISEILDEQKNIEGKTGYQLKIEKLEQQVIDYETDWRKMRKYYDGAMEKMAIAIEALEEIGRYKKAGYISTLRGSVFDVAKEALEKIKDPRSVQEKFNDIANGRD